MLDYPPLPPPAPVVVIEENAGGLVDIFAERVLVYEKIDAKVRIMGPCQSSCTMVTRLPRENICVGPNASLDFHQAFRIWPDRPLNYEDRDEDHTRKMMSFYPRRLRDWIASHGGLTATLISLKGTELRRLFNAC